MDQVQAQREIDNLKKKVRRHKEVLIVGGVVLTLMLVNRRGVNKQMAKIDERVAALLSQNVSDKAGNLEFTVSPQQIKAMVKKGSGIIFETKFGEFVMMNAPTYDKLLVQAR